MYLAISPISSRINLKKKNPIFLVALWIFLGTFISFVNKVLLIPFNLQTFISFICLTAFAKTSSKMWNKSDKKEHPCLINFREKLSDFLKLSTQLAIFDCYCWFSLSIWRNFFTPGLLRIVIMNGSWVCQVLWCSVSNIIIQIFL